MTRKRVYIFMAIAAAGEIALGLWKSTLPFYIIVAGALYTGGLTALIWKNILQV